MTKRTVTIPNISCGHCVTTIEREVSELQGVTSVTADPITKRVEVAYDESATEWSAVESLLREIHYPPVD
jgi:copper chaperone CopZ